MERTDEEDHEMETMELRVPGMTCGHCEAAVKGEIAKLPGVASVSVDLSTKAVVVVGEGLEWEAIAAAVDEAGYEAER